MSQFLFSGWEKKKNLLIQYGENIFHSEINCHKLVNMNKRVGENDSLFPFSHFFHKEI